MDAGTIRRVALCFHPHLYDHDRFEAELAGLDPSDLEGRALVLAACADDDLGPAFEGEDLIGGRRHPETGEDLGGVTDAVRQGLDASSDAARLLTKASCVDGPLSCVVPALGQLTPAEVRALFDALERISLDVAGLDADRRLLLRLLAIARERRQGLVFMAL